MVTRRGFLALCGATAVGAALPSKTAVAEQKAFEYKFNPPLRRVRPGLYTGEIAEPPKQYVRPGVYIGDTRPTVPEYTYTQKPGLRAFYEYLEALDELALFPGYSVYYDHLTFLDSPAGTPFVVQGRTNIPRDKLDSMWERAMRRAWMPSGTVLNPHRGIGFDDVHLPRARKKERFDV